MLFDPSPDSDTGPREPNRFDPFEALDTIRSCAQEVEIDHDDVQEIMRQLYALRAYITGMER